MQTANSIYFDYLRDTAGLAFVLAILAVLLIVSIRRSEDPPLLIFKWVITACIGVVLVRKAMPLIAVAGYEAIGGLVLTLICGLGLALTWRRSIGALIAKPFASLYDGGDAQIEPRPYYSIAEAKRKRGQYQEAIAELRKQLTTFPSDLEGQLKLAEILVEHLNDLQGAEIAIQRVCAQPGHAPVNIAFALNTLADWHLKFAQDREAARQDLQKIIDAFPDTELAAAAAQRIAHLAGTGRLLEAFDRIPLAVPEGVRKLGLMQSTAHLAPAQANPETLAAEYVKHLEQHPLDTEIREKLAVLYADHFGRLDLAVDQLQQLINAPNQSGKLVVRWVNLLADVQLRHGGDYNTVRQTLEQIIERYPNLPAAGIARNRIDLLALELKAKVKSRVLKLGTYEQNIGLKRDSPHQL